MTAFIEKIVGDLGDKRRWRQCRARVRALPAGGRISVEALERYLTHFGTVTNGDVPFDAQMSMLEELVDLFEQAAADGKPVRTVVVGDPVEFAETIFGNHSDGRWVSREHDPSIGALEREFHQEIERGITTERTRLVGAVERAERTRS